MASAKINITLHEDLLSRLDQYADENGMTRSGLIQMACKQYLNAADNAPLLTRIMANIADLTQKVSDQAISADAATLQLDTIDGQLDALADCVPPEFRK